VTASARVTMVVMELFMASSSSGAARAVGQRQLSGTG